MKGIEFSFLCCFLLLLRFDGRDSCSPILHTTTTTGNNNNTILSDISSLSPSTATTSIPEYNYFLEK
jgi:hypothetical protein